jgi:hypothetical protein
MTCRKGGWKDHDNGRVVCRSLELRTALGMIEDHNRLLPATESGSGLVNNAMRSWSVLVLGCVLFALGALLCVGKESQAKPPALAPEPGSSATSQRPVSHDPPRAPIAEERAPVVQQEPAHRELVARGPASRPAQQPDGRTAPDRGPTTDARGRQVGPQGKTALEPTGLREHGPQKTVEPGPARPVPQRPEARPASAGWDAPGRNVGPPGRQVGEQGKPAYEPPGLREHRRENSLPESVGSGSTRPRPEKADQDTSSRPVHEQPVPKTNPHASAGTGPQEGAGAPDEHSKPAISPGKENVPPEQAEAAGPKPDKMAGNSAYKPDGSGKGSPVSGHPDRTGASTSTPDSGPTSMGSAGMEDPGRGSPVRTLAADETGVRPGAGPSQPQTGTSGRRPAELGGEDSARVAGPSSVPAPERRSVESVSDGPPVLGGDTVPAAPPGGDQSPAGVQAQVASGTYFGSAKILADPLWDERGSLVDITPEVLRAGPVDPHAAPRSASFRGSISPRGPPLDVPSPFFGFVPMIGGAATGAAGSSGTGAAPLLAVIASCLIALLYQGRSRIACNFLPLRTVPQPALERPG